MFTPVAMPQEGDSPTVTAAPERLIRLVTFRAGSGRSRMRSRSTTAATPKLRVSTAMLDGVAETVIVSFSAPTESAASTTRLAFTCRTIFDRTKVRKPCSAASTLYDPIGRLGTEY
jgi:hypothetical protein